MTLRVLSCGSVLVLQVLKAPGNSKLISSRSILFSSYCHWQTAVPNCLACEYSRFSFIHFPHIEWMFSLNVPGGGCIRRLRISYWEVRKTKKDRLMTGYSVPQDNPLSILYFLPFFIYNFYLFICLRISVFFSCVLLTRGRTQICPLG